MHTDNRKLAWLALSVLALALGTGAAVALDARPTAADSEPELPKAATPVLGSASGTLVPKRVRLIIGFQQTVAA